MIDLRKKDDMIAAIEEILQQEALKGNQHLIDKNKNNKVDPEDFKILRGEKKTVKEEETVDEGIKELAKKAFKALTGGSDEDQLKNLQKKMGVPQTGKKPEPQKEEVEQIDELSKSTLGSYVKSAARDVGASRKLASDFENNAKSARKQSVKDANTRLSDKFKGTAMKRHAGIGKAVERLTKEEVELDETAAWQRKEGKRESGGLNQKGVESYRREHPGSKLKTAVTTKPSKLKPGSKAANRRKSFCARMSGMKKRLTSAKTANDPDSRINKSLRKWNC